MQTQASFTGLPRLQFLIARAVCKNRGRRPGESYHVICRTHAVTDSRHKDIFTFISPATEKLEKQDKFHPKDKSYLQSIPESEAEPLKDSSAASVAIPKVAACSLLKFCHCRYFTLVVQQPFSTVAEKGHSILPITAFLILSFPILSFPI